MSKLIGNAVNAKKGWVIPATLIAGACFWVLPAGINLPNYAPDWISLILIYWCFAMPGKIGLGYAWCVGLFLDILSFGTLGRYALSKVVIVFLAQRFAFRVRAFPVWQQSFVILFLLVIETAVLSSVAIMMGKFDLSYSRWIAVATGSASWFVVYFVLRRLRHWAHLP